MMKKVSQDKLRVQCYKTFFSIITNARGKYTRVLVHNKSFQMILVHSSLFVLSISDDERSFAKLFTVITDARGK